MTMTVNPAGIARRKNGAPPPDVPLADIDLGTLEFVYYENCTAAWDAGAAPLDEGDDGYEAPRLDRDQDGIACEIDPR